MTWTLPLAMDMARAIEAVSPAFGFHVGLTGGLLYKDGPRKDADMLFYSIRQTATPDQPGLIAALAGCGITIKSTHGWMAKAEWRGMPVDLFFPETRKSVADGSSSDEPASVEMEAA